MILNWRTYIDYPFVGLELSPEHRFSPRPKQPFQRVFLSFTKTYWLAFVASLDADRKEEIATRLDRSAPFGDTIPQLDGSRCVKKPGELTAKEVKALMQTTFFLIHSFAPFSVARSWRELGVVGMKLWEDY